MVPGSWPRPLWAPAPRSSVRHASALGAHCSRPQRHRGACRPQRHRGAGCGCPVVPGTEPLQEIHGVAGVQLGLRVSREGVDSFSSGPTSSCLRPSQTPMKVVPVFPHRAARVWGDALEGAGQAASPWEPLAQLKGASGRRQCPSLGWASISSQGSCGGGQEQLVLLPVPSATFGSQDASCEALTRSAPVRPPGQSWFRRRAGRGAAGSLFSRAPWPRRQAQVERLRLRFLVELGERMERKSTSCCPTCSCARWLVPARARPGIEPQPGLFGTTL